MDCPLKMFELFVQISSLMTREPIVQNDLKYLDSTSKYILVKYLDQGARSNSRGSIFIMTGSLVVALNIKRIIQVWSVKLSN